MTLGGETNVQKHHFQKQPTCRKLLHQVSGNRALTYTNFSCHATCSLQEKFRFMFNQIELPCGLRALFGLGVQLQSTVPRPRRFYAFQTKSHPGAVIPAVIAEMRETWWQTGQRSKRWSIHGQWREGKISLLHMQFVKVMTATQMHKLKSWSMSHGNGSNRLRVTLFSWWGSEKNLFGSRAS